MALRLNGDQQWTGKGKGKQSGGDWSKGTGKGAKGDKGKGSWTDPKKGKGKGNDAKGKAKGKGKKNDEGGAQPDDEAGDGDEPPAKKPKP